MAKTYSTEETTTTSESTSDAQTVTVVNSGRPAPMFTAAAKQSFLTSTKRIDGQSVNTSNTTELNIMEGLNQLSSHGLANFAADSSDLTAQATNFLQALNVTVDVQHGKSLNLKDTQTNRQQIANPNLADRNIKNIKKEQKTALDKFPCSEDSFYELDETPSESAQKKNRDIKQAQVSTVAIQGLAGDLAGVNLASALPNVATAQFK